MTHTTLKPLRRCPRFVLAAALVAAASCAGCGGGDSGGAAGKPADTKAERAAVRRVLADLQAASRAGDGKRICDKIFTPKLAQSVAKSAASGSCATEVKQNLFSPTTQITVNRVAVNAPADATATVAEANGNISTVSLVKEGGRWLIRGVQAAQSS